jgi:hypothetical protein
MTKSTMLHRSEAFSSQRCRHSVLTENQHQDEQHQQGNDKRKISRPLDKPGFPRPVGIVSAFE